MEAICVVEIDSAFLQERIVIKFNESYTLIFSFPKIKN